jgi:hypothetical protein
MIYKVIKRGLPFAAFESFTFRSRPSPSGRGPPLILIKAHGQGPLRSLSHCR